MTNNNKEQDDRVYFKSHEMSKLSILKFVSLLAALLVFAPYLTGCKVTSAVSIPLLPPGFLNTPVPDVNLDGYIYLNQESPIIISPDLLRIAIPEISIESAQLWLGPNANSVGGAVYFESQADAQLIYQLMKSSSIPIWSLATGKVIYVVNNDPGQWNSLSEDALTKQRVLSLEAQYPEILADFAYFPANPPLKPFGAGFIDANSNLVDSISASYGLALNNYKSALTLAKISRISFVAYTEQPLTISSKTLTEEYIKSFHVGILAIGRSNYPGIAISILFDKAMAHAGFIKQTVSNIDMYEYSLSGVELVVAHKGNVIYVAASQTKELAEKLLLSCFL
jgi:hypothetical protein